MKAFARILMCAAVLMSCVVFSVACSKEDDTANIKPEKGILATHTFVISPDMLDLTEMVIEWTDFTGETKIDTVRTCKWEKEMVSSSSTQEMAISEFKLYTRVRDDVEVRNDRTYDLAVLYNFTAIKLYGNGVGKPITTGRPISDLTLMEMDIHKKYVERLLDRLPEEVSCLHYFNDSPFGMQYVPSISYGDNE